MRTRAQATAIRSTAALFLAVGLSSPVAADPIGADPPPATLVVPEIRYEAPARWGSLCKRLSATAPRDLAAAMELVGLVDGGPPIRVVLAEEDTVAARRAPPWGLGYAIDNAGLVVLLPSRVPSYPHDSLETVLHHELAHVVIARAARRRAVPRWLHEGVAMYAAREWGFPDRSRVLWSTLRHGGSSLPGLDAEFSTGAASAARAYALSGAFVRYLFERHGDDVVARILAGLGDDLSVYRAFREATGESLLEVERSFWRDLAFWNRWVPFLTSSATLWIAVTVLAVWAFRRRRRRDAEIRARWEEEERLVEQRLAWTTESGEWVN